ncbi:MAG: carbon-nitrogen hydrolase family protein [Rhizobiaceae bacterium]
MSATLKVACVQMCSGTDIESNIVAMEGFIREAAAQGVTYVQTPEMSGILQRDTKALFASIFADKDDPVFAKASQLAKELGIWVHIGSTAIDRGDGKAANRAGLFSPTGERVASYDKIHMFDVDLANGESWRESKVFHPGEKCVVSQIDEIPLGMAICYDVRFPHLFRAQARQGAEILTCPAAFTRQTGEAHWHVLLRSRAIENGAFMVVAAQGGMHEDGRETYGHSLIINPWGEIIGELDHNMPGIVVAELDLSEVAKARQRIPGLANEREFS